MKIDIHNTGGSGPYGNGAYTDRANGCLEYAILSLEHPQHCSLIYKPTAGGKPNAMLVGSMVHALAEYEASDGWPADLDAASSVQFVDSACKWDPPADACAEAFRVFSEWRKIRADYATGDDVVGVELLLDAKLPSPKEGGEPLPVNARIDRLVRDADGVLCLEDLKTTAAGGDKHTSGRTRLQLHLYCLAAWANGYDVQRLRVRQIVKTKQVREELFTLDLPNPSREKWVARYLCGALERERLGATGPWGGGCDFCRFKRDLICEL